jgi:hypothetical protein
MVLRCISFKQLVAELKRITHAHITRLDCIESLMATESEESGKEMSVFCV